MASPPPSTGSRREARLPLALDSGRDLPGLRSTLDAGILEPGPIDLRLRRANPEETRKLLHGVDRFLTRLVLKALHPGVAAAGQQLAEDYNLDRVELVLPTTLFDIQITFERLGALRCRFAEPTGKLLPSRWPVREPLRKYHG